MITRNLGTFSVELGGCLTWVLNSPVALISSLRCYSAPTLEKIASRFRRALDSVLKDHFLSVPLILFCTQYFCPCSWMPFMFTASAGSPVVANQRAKNNNIKHISNWIFFTSLLPTALRRVEFIKLATEDREQNG